MDRAILEFNRIIVNRRNTANKQLHKHNLRNITKLVKNEMPATMAQGVIKKGKELAYESKAYRVQVLDRVVEIERQNKMLLQRLVDIV